MDVEYPVSEYHIPPFIGLYCGIILHDGSTHYGTVAGCEKGKLILNPSDSEGDAETDSLKVRDKADAKKPRRSLKSKKADSLNSAFDLESIAVLFALFP